MGRLTASFALPDALQGTEVDEDVDEGVLVGDGLGVDVFGGCALLVGVTLRSSWERMRAPMLVSKAVTQPPLGQQS